MTKHGEGKSSSGQRSSIESGRRQYKEKKGIIPIIRIYYEGTEAAAREAGL